MSAVACCHKDKGWTLVSMPLNENDLTIKSEGLYQVKIHNQGDVTLVVEGIEINSGACLPIGIDFLPCSQNLDFEFKDEPGTKKAYVSAVKIVEYCCE